MLLFSLGKKPLTPPDCLSEGGEIIYEEKKKKKDGVISAFSELVLLKTFNNSDIFSNQNILS